MDAAAAEPPLNIFVNYRRTDSAGHAGRLQDALNREFGKDHVFYDVTDIEGGIDFAAAVRAAIEKASVVLVVIGPRWKHRRPGDRLLGRPDWVLFEIAHARNAGKPVLPVLVGGAVMPGALPAPARFLSTVNAFSLRDESWDTDVQRLVASLPRLARSPVTPSGSPATLPPRRRNVVAAVAALALIALVVFAAVLGKFTRPDTAAGIGPSNTSTAQAEAPPAAKPPVPQTSTARGSTPPDRADPPAAANHPPTTGSIEVDQFNAVGLMSATRFTLKARNISDPDGDPLRYRWDFGDGSPAPPSSATVTKVYDRVNRFQVSLYVSDGRVEQEVLAAQTYVTVRDVTGTWQLSMRPDPKASIQLPPNFTVTLVQQGNQLSGRIVPAESTRSTVLTGYVEHPNRVNFGSESAWWNDDSDAYFDLYVSDGALFIQMMNLKPNSCGAQIPCLSALMRKQ
jgi:hypothetical protein